ncbi:MAG: S46 family peptidase [Planctomycetota bacterium]
MIARSALLLVIAVTLLPDEGQWLPTQVRDWDWAALQKRGMKLGKDEFWHPERGGVLSATVQINGCTASFVSKDGLMVTNHHCGFDAVATLSSTEHNWLRDGFAAADRAAELPAEGMVAFVLKRIENVTDTVHAAQDAAKTDLERWTATQQVTARLVAEGQQKEADTVCSVASFLEGKEYHLYYRTRITDVRLVYAPPRAIGEFGGEVDNWEWPRHTGDFSFFRAYVGKDGTPKPYDAENVPFRPQHSLAIAKDGVHETDLAIVMGYPGNTQRYKTSRSVATREGYVYPKRDQLLTAVIGVLEQQAKTSEQSELDYASTIKSLANVQKNARGMVFGLRRNAVAERKLREEADLVQWIGAAPDRSQRWGNVLSELLAIDEEEAKSIDRELAIGFAANLLGNAPLVDALIEACAAATDRKTPLPASLVGQLGVEELEKDLESVQLPVLGIVLDELRSLPPERRLAGTTALKSMAEEPSGLACARELLAGSKMRTGEGRKLLFSGDIAAIAESTDPLVVLARGIATERRAFQRAMRERQGKMLVAGRRWIEAQEAYRGKSFYPDANSTLRVSIAEVKGYAPRDGVRYVPHTTVAGLLAKETGSEPFANPPALLAAAAARKDSRWFDAAIGDVPVCFLTNADTTGGNSGSPVVNGKGELIGLNFDRVFENVAGDFGWNPDRSRNVCCDVRYLLWVVESVLPSPTLLKELGF